MKGVFVILDGVADEPCQSLGYITPLQAAKTPNLDYFSSRGSIDHCFSMKEGVSPQSSSAMISLFGFDPNFAFRGPLEAQGAGIKLSRGDLALRTDFATIDDLDNRAILDRRAGRSLTSRETRHLAKAINENVKMPFKFEFHPTVQHKGVLVFRGGFSDNITNVDPEYGRGVVLQSPNGKIEFSKPMDDEEDSKLAAELVNKFLRESHRVLDKHPLNLARAKKGLYSANFLLCRDAGNEPVKFKKLRGKWRAFVYSPSEKGIAQAMKMDVHNFAYPRAKSMDIYANLHTGLNKAIKSSIKMLKKNSGKYDYFYIHLKETDVPGHDNKPMEKVRMIETIDKKLFSYLRRYVRRRKAKLIVASDHVCSCRTKSHGSGAVPVLFYDASAERDVNEKRFTEEQAMKGRKIVGRKLLERTLFSK